MSHNGCRGLNLPILFAHSVKVGENTFWPTADAQTRSLHESGRLVSGLFRQVELLLVHDGALVGADGAGRREQVVSGGRLRWGLSLVAGS